MRFSVVITTHNRRALLDRAIRSALAQPLTAEAIVVDDASSDGTDEYVAQLQAQLHEVGDRRLVYHRNETNLGHSQSVNRGVELATSDWIKFLDDDDYLGLQCLSAMAKAIATHPNAVLCSCQASQVDEQEREIERSPSTGPGRAFYIPQEDIHYGMLLEVVPFGTPVQVAAKKSAFLRSGGWDSEFDGNCDDIDSWTRIAQFGDAVFLNQCLVYRTVWPGSYNQKFAIARRLQTNIQMKRKIYALVHPKYRDYLPDIAEVERYLSLHWGLVALWAGHLLTGASMMFSVGVSPTAWLLLVRAIVFRQSPWLINQTHVSVRQNASRGLRSAAPQPGPPDRSTSVKFSSPYSPSWRDPARREGPAAIAPAVPPAEADAARLSRVAKPRTRHHGHKTRTLRHGIRIRNFWQMLLLGKLRLALRLSGPIFSEYAQRGLVKLYPATPPIAKIPIAASSHHHAEMAIDILKRIANRKNSSLLTKLPVLRRYLRIRCAIAAFRQGYWLMAVCMAVPAIFSPTAWRLWLRLVRARQLQVQEDSIRKIFLAPSPLPPASPAIEALPQPHVQNP
ncbi:MAG: glycosyltransferase family 2 protein [Geitlerinemataceae cyanobacterium]